MKNLISPVRATTLILLLLYPIVSSAQNPETLLWPIKGQEAGTNILLRPQDLLDHEVNYATLVIGAKEGTEVIAPADGEVASKMRLCFRSGLYQSAGYGFDDANTFDAMRQKMEADPDVRNPKKYINGDFSLKLADGRNITFNGLRGNIEFKSGQRIKAGTVIGTVSYVFEKIGEPHIAIEISKGELVDPLTPFGLQTTFKEAEKFTPPEKLSREQANEDFDFFIQSIRECYPSLRDIISSEREAEFIREGKARLDSAEIHFTTLYNLIGDAFCADFLHDSHAWRQSPNPFFNARTDTQYPAVVLCTLGDRMFVRVVQPGYDQYLGKEVATIDGILAKEQAAYVRSRTNLFDAQVQSTGAVQMLTNWSIQYRDNNCDKPANLTFTDGSTVEVPFLKPNQVKKFIPRATAPIAYNVHRSQNLREDWSFRLLDENIALLTLAHFHMNDVQMDAIADSLRGHANIPNLIVDVRDNPGGDAGCEAKMVQWFLTESGPSNLTYQKVMSNTTYPCFTNCYNWSATMQPFEKFVKVDGMEGFYNRDISRELKVAQHQKKPSSKKKKARQLQTDAIYKGKLYILTNENSASAATDFPAHLVRAGRAVTIGRETATAYHYMTAMKFAHLFLPHSHIEYQLPLIKAVTASDVSERFPYGRGLLPDYEVPLTREEIFSSTEDIILNRAKEIILQNNNQN